MIDEFEGYMKQGYDLKKLLNEVEKDLDDVRRKSNADDSFINQVDQFLHNQNVTQETLKQ